MRIAPSAKTMNTAERLAGEVLPGSEAESGIDGEIKDEGATCLLWPMGPHEGAEPLAPLRPSPASPRERERASRVTQPEALRDRPASRGSNLVVAGPEGPGARLERLWRMVAIAAGRIREQPIATFAAAMGVGFALGGVLSSRAGRIALAAVARRVAVEVLKQVL